MEQPKLEIVNKLETMKLVQVFGYDPTNGMERVEVPVGKLCAYCTEVVEPRDQGVILSCGSIEHIECFHRQVAGSVDHQTGRCSCCGGKDEGEEGMTRRQAARAAFIHFMDNRK